MSTEVTRKLEKAKIPASHAGAVTPNRTVEVSSYIKDMVRGLRRVTKGAKQRDLLFLDSLLAMAEQEAAKLSTHIYH